MNYNTYKIKKLLSKMFDKLIDVIFYLPRHLYKNNVRFRKWLDGRESKSYKRRRNKILASRIFRCLDRQQKCIVYSGFDSDDNFNFDYADYGFEELLSDKKWISKNKLKVKQMTLLEYVEKHMTKRRYLVTDWNKDKLIYIITR